MCEHLSACARNRAVQLTFLHLFWQSNFLGGKKFESDSLAREFGRPDTANKGNQRFHQPGYAFSFQ